MSLCKFQTSAAAVFGLAAVPVAAAHFLKQKCTKKDMQVLQGITGQGIWFPSRVGDTFCVTESELS